MIHAVIMAGGVGTRFWPLSRKKAPKQVLDLLGKGPMFQQTISRVESIVPAEQRWIVTNRGQMKMMREVMPELAERQFIIEPVGRNTAPAIGLAAVHLLKEDPDAVMIVLPADHQISDEDKFRSCLMTAVEAVKDNERLATIGIEPNRPETGYGYIQINTKQVDQEGRVFSVKTFAEKPNLETAKRFLQAGEFLWNSGIFIWRADAILNQIAEHLPHWYSGLQKIGSAKSASEERRIAEEVFDSLKGTSIDYAVMEHAPEVVVVRGDFGWSDVGSFDEVWRLLPKDENGNACRGIAELVQSKNNFVLSPNRLIALVGVEDLLVVDAGDAVLICHRDDSQNIRKLVDALEKSDKKKGFV